MEQRLEEVQVEEQRPEEQLLEKIPEEEQQTEVQVLRVQNLQEQIQEQLNNMITGRQLFAFHCGKQGVVL